MRAVNTQESLNVVLVTTVLSRVATFVSDLARYASCLDSSNKFQPLSSCSTLRPPLNRDFLKSAEESLGIR
jgi:hypothetical protein